MHVSMPQQIVMVFRTKALPVMCSAPAVMNAAGSGITPSPSISHVSPDVVNITLNVAFVTLANAGSLTGAGKKDRNTVLCSSGPGI
jgi:hypothetical protein